MKAKWFLGAFALFAAATLASCDPDKPQDEQKEVFPKRADMTVNAEERGTLEFNLPFDWELMVDGDWFRFVLDENDTEGKADTVGKKGTVSMKYYINSVDLQDFSPASTQVFLTMNGESRVIFDVTRLPRGAEGALMYIKPLSGDAYWAKELVFTFNRNSAGQFNIGFMANFDWEILSVPTGVTVEEKYEDNGGPLIPFEDEMNSMTQFRYISIVQERIGYALPADAKIVLKNRQNEQTASFPVIYAGMGEADIMVSPGALTRGVGFTKDGFALALSGGSEPTDQKVQKGIAYVKDMDYSLFVVELNLGTFTSTDITGDGWVNVTKKENGNFEFSVDENTGAAREAYLLVLPKVFADNPKLTDFEQIDTYMQNGYAIKITQNTGEVSTGGFFVGWGSTQEVPTTGLSQDFAMMGGTPPKDGQFPADGSTWEYVFKNADVSGGLVVLPLAFKNQQWGFIKIKTYQVGNWDGVTVEGTNAYPDGLMAPGVGGAVRLNGITATGSLRAAQLLFFKEDYRLDDPGTPEDDNIDLETQKADAAIVLIQQP